MIFSLFARIVYRVNSSFSGEIIVKEQLGKHTLYVKGVPQSGGIAEEVWKKGVRVLPEFKSVPNILLLGLGGGSVVHLLKKRWPQATILGVEIDPQIVVIGRTYFRLEEVTGLKIVTADAREVVLKRKHGLDKARFDLILVDTYLGKELPTFVRQDEFVNELRAFLAQEGLLVFNYLLDKEGRQTVSQFEQGLKRLFPKIRTLQTLSNELIFAHQA